MIDVYWFYTHGTYNPLKSPSDTSSTRHANMAPMMNWRSVDDDCIAILAASQETSD